MDYKYLLFDLDGTLTDPKVGITKAVAYSLKKMKGFEVDPDGLTKFIGPPLKDSYIEYYGFSEAEAYEAIESFREYFSVTGLYENEVYEGIIALLKILKKQGKKLIVATSKPTVFAEIILKHFNMKTYFTHIVGSNLDGTQTKKSEVIAAALEVATIKDQGQAIMIGDREHDILGAKEMGLDSIGLEYGYGSFQELQTAGADYIVEDVKGLRDLLLHNI